MGYCAFLGVKLNKGNLKKDDDIENFLPMLAKDYYICSDNFIVYCYKFNLMNKNE